MIAYERPALPAVIYLDDTGTPIPYGSRWRGASPPEDSYSRTENLDRFEPLHTVARALIDWIVVTFDVSVDSDPEVAADLGWQVDDVDSVVRIIPRDAAAAPLTVVFTSFPGVVLRMGVLFQSAFPMCGCDACDDDVLWLVDQIEWMVQAVVAGGYSEQLDAEPDGWFEYTLENDTGMQSGRSEITGLPAERVAAARDMLPASGTWSAWPRREG